jgi:hypothetical protein
MNGNSSSGGITVTGLLQVAFIVLKLCHVIDWPWVWVLSPTWITCALILIILIVVFIVKLWRDN